MFLFQNTPLLVASELRLRSSNGLVMDFNESLIGVVRYGVQDVFSRHWNIFLGIPCGHWRWGLNGFVCLALKACHARRDRLLAIVYFTGPLSPSISEE